MIQYKLNDQSREKLVEIFPPTFPDVICHHITHIFDTSDEKYLPKNPTKVLVVGYAISDNIECLVVSIDGRTNRPDSKLYHITHSIDRAAGAKPVMSNDVLKGGYMKIEPIIIGVTVEIVK